MKPKSTADKLRDFRERLSAHYRAQRNPKCKPIVKPQVDEFAPMFRGFAERIMEEELARHTRELERMKQ